MRQETLERLTFVCGYLTGVAGAVRDDTNTAVATNDHVEVIRHYAALRNATKQIKEARAALDEMEERLSREQVPDVMRAHGIRTTTIEGVGRVSLSNRWSCSMVDKEAGIDWLRGNGHDSLIQETVNSSTLAAFAKDMSIEHGIDLPDALFRTSIMTFTSITKA
jgi:hypothetical protein